MAAFVVVFVVGCVAPVPDGDEVDASS